MNLEQIQAKLTKGRENLQRLQGQSTAYVEKLIELGVDEKDISELDKLENFIESLKERIEKRSKKVDKMTALLHQKMEQDGFI
jgi:flagellar biosynthesis chaperone FliJ